MVISNEKHSSNNDDSNIPKVGAFGSCGIDAIQTTLSQAVVDQNVESLYGKYEYEREDARNTSSNLKHNIIYNAHFIKK